MFTPDVAAIQPGEILQNRYCVMSQIAIGGMGSVYACRDLDANGALVAVKLVQGFGHERDSYMVTRFDNEIELTLRVNHPNVVRGYDYFVESGMIGFVTELVNGECITDYIERNGPCSIEEAMNFLVQVCEGVRAIHAAGIIHRDLSSENVLITEAKEVKIIDFGVAKTTANARQLTQHGAIVGNLHCVSPEYVAEGKLDRRSDIYAIGVLGYMMLTGKVPFEGANFVETLTKRVKEEVPQVSALCPECPEELNRIIAKAMAKLPKDRYQAASDLLLDLYQLKPEWHNNYTALKLKVRREVWNDGTSIEEQLQAVPMLESRPKQTSGEFVSARPGAKFAGYNNASSRSMGMFVASIMMLTLVCLGLVGRNLILAADAEIQTPQEIRALNERAHLSVPKPEFITHTISARGETLSKIAAQYTGDARNWRAIAEFNPGLNPERIFIGQTLKVPSKLVKESAAKAESKA